MSPQEERSFTLSEINDKRLDLVETAIEKVKADMLTLSGKLDLFGERQVDTKEMMQEIRDDMKRVQDSLTTSTVVISSVRKELREIMQGYTGQVEDKLNEHVNDQVKDLTALSRRLSGLEKSWKTISKLFIGAIIGLVTSIAGVLGPKLVDALTKIFHK